MYRLGSLSVFNTDFSYLQSHLILTVVSMCISVLFFLIKNYVSFFIFIVYFFFSFTRATIYCVYTMYSFMLTIIPSSIEWRPYWNCQLLFTFVRFEEKEIYFHVLHLKGFDIQFPLNCCFVYRNQNRKNSQPLILFTRIHKSKVFISNCFFFLLL